jgi:chromosome partitioning protein
MAKTVLKIAFINGKGGCGKTTSAFHLTGVLAARGERVLCIDLDGQANFTSRLLMNNEENKTLGVFDFLFGEASIQEIHKKAYFRERGNWAAKYCGVDVLPSDKRLKYVDANNSGNFDASKIKAEYTKFLTDEGYTWVIIDMPPSSQKLNEICFENLADYAVIPFTTDDFSVSGYGDLLDGVQAARGANTAFGVLGVYLSRYRADGLSKYIKSELQENFGKDFIDIQIPERADIREAVYFGRPISYYKQVSKGRDAYEALLAEIEQRIEKRK